MSILTEALASLFECFNLSTYLVLSGVIMSVCGTVWVLVRHKIQHPAARRLWLSLILAFASAPSIFGVHAGGITVPAVIVLILGTSGLRLIAVMWAAVSIIVTWGLVFGIWKLISIRCTHLERDAD